MWAASRRSKIQFGSWRVSDEISMSNHRQITFELTDVKQEIRLWKNPRKTDWVGYEEELTEKVKQLLVRLSTGCEIEHCADTLRECIVRSYENNCSLSSKVEGHGKIWWSPELSALRKEVRRQYNKSYRSKSETDRKAFRDAQKGIRTGWESQLAEILLGG